MLYLLLVIIAVGVLLASEWGRVLLGLIVLLGIIAGLLYVGFWVLVIGYGLFSYKIRGDVASGIMITGGVIFGIILVNYIVKHKEKTKGIIAHHLHEAWKDQKIGIIIGMISILFLVAVIIWAWIIKVYK